LTLLACEKKDDDGNRSTTSGAHRNKN